MSNHRPTRRGISPSIRDFRRRSIGFYQSQAVVRWSRRPTLRGWSICTESPRRLCTSPIVQSPRRTPAQGTGSLIGVPIPDLELYVLDRYQNPVPIGVPGELYVGGAGVAKGYLNRSELTSDRFISNPFDPQSAGKLYRSGDLVRLLPNRDIEYLGRIDTRLRSGAFESN